MMCSVEEYTGSAAEWDGFGQQQLGWTHCHQFVWKRVMEQAFRHPCPYLAARTTDGSLCGILPLVSVRSVLFGHQLVSMPYLNYGGPLGTIAAVQALARAADELARRIGAPRTELRSLHPLPLGTSTSTHKITAILDLPRTTDAFWSGLPSKVRSQARRPAREGVYVEHGPEQLDPFVQVFSSHMTWLGTPTHSPRLFEAVREHFGSDAWFSCAYLGEEPIAAGCSIRSGSEMEIVWASALAAHKRIAANMLLYAQLMERAIGCGVERFNFGRCTPGSGAHQFKAQWGTRDVPLYWYRSGHSADATGLKDGVGQWGPRMWRHLPLPVARVLGPWIRKGIPL